MAENERKDFIDRPSGVTADPHALDAIAEAGKEKPREPSFIRRIYKTVIYHPRKRGEKHRVEYHPEKPLGK